MSIPVTATTEYIWFGSRAVDFVNGGNTGAQLEVLSDASDFATRTVSNGTFDFTGSEWQQFLAFSATAAEMAALGVNVLDGSVDTAVSGQVNSTGDLRVGMGVEAYNIADMSGGGRLVDTTGNLDDADDPIVITGLGKAGSGKLDSASIDAADAGNRVVFSNDIGFGFIGGSGFETSGNAVRINDGESINFEIQQGRLLSQASFTVKVLGGASTEIVIDSDGATIRDTNGDLQGGFVQDGSAGELSLGVLAHMTKVTINFLNQTIWFNGNQQYQGDTSGFFQAFVDGGSKNLTLGSVVGNQTGWSADDLVLATENAPPVAALPAGGIGDEDTEITGSVGATDPNGDPLTYAVLPGDGPAHGSVVFSNDGSYVYTPDANYNGSDGFTVTISDGQGGETSVFVEVTVLPVNDDPVAQGFTGGTGNEDTQILGDVDADDVDGDTLAYTVEAGDGPAHGSVVVNSADGTFTYTPNADFNGADAFTVTISDGNGGTATQVVNITVNAVNDAATFGGDDSGAVQEDGTLIAGGTLTVDDVDAGEGVFASTSALAGVYGDFTFTLATGAWTYTLRNGDANVQALGASDTVQDSLTVTSADGSFTTIVVDIAGADEPVTDATLPSPNTGTGDPNDSPTLPTQPGGSYTQGNDSGNNYSSDNGAQRYDGNGGNDTISTGDGNDAVLGGDGNDRINTGDDNDYADGEGGADSIRGGEGNDALLGGDDNDTIRGDDGADSIYGQDGADSLSGGDDDDRVYGGPGADTILGGDGGDSLYGGSGNDSIAGNDENDTIVGGYGADTTAGNGGTDRFVFLSTDDTNDVITDFDGSEVLDFSAFPGTLTFLATESTIFTANNQVAWFKSGGDTIVMVNTDGDNATAEFMVTLQGYTTDMVLNDFVL